MKKYTLKVKGMWGVCRHCFKPLMDDDFIYGTGYCSTCDIVQGTKKLRNIFKIKQVFKF